jgi:hypothetical protein
MLFRMTRLTLVFLLLVSFSAAAIAEKVPSDAWQTGTLKDTSDTWHSRSAGFVSGTHGNLNGSMVSREYPIVRYVIDAGQYTYEADLVLRHKRDKRPAVTINGPITFAVVKSDLFIQDEQGKEHKLQLARKTLKTAVAQPAEQK